MWHANVLKDRGTMGDSSWLNECRASICRDYRPTMCGAGDRQSWKGKPYICQVTKIHPQHQHPIAETYVTSNRYNLVSRRPPLRHVLNSGWVYSACFRKASCFFTCILFALLRKVCPTRSHGGVQSSRDDDSQPSTHQPRTSSPGFLH